MNNVIDLTPSSIPQGSTFQTISLLITTGGVALTIPPFVIPVRGVGDAVVTSVPNEKRRKESGERQALRGYG